MGKISHASVGTSLTQSEFESSNAHIDSEGSVIEIVRTATCVVAASDAPASVLAQADYVCDGTADDVQILLALAAGRDVYLSQGIFYLAADIDIVGTDRYIHGAGYRTILQVAANNINILHFSGAGDYNYLSNFRIDGEGYTGIKGIYAEDTARFHGDHLWVRNCDSIGIDLKYNHSFFFSDFMVESCGTGIRVGSGTPRVNVASFDRGLVESCTGVGMLIGACDSFAARSLTIEANGLQGIKTALVGNEIFSGLVQSCLFEDNNATVTADTPDIDLAGCSHWKVENCMGVNNDADYMLKVRSSSLEFHRNNNHWSSSVLVGDGELINAAALPADPYY